MIHGFSVLELDSEGSNSTATLTNHLRYLQLRTRFGRKVRPTLGPATWQIVIDFHLA